MNQQLILSFDKRIAALKSLIQEENEEITKHRDNIVEYDQRLERLMKDKENILIMNGGVIA